MLYHTRISLILNLRFKINLPLSSFSKIIKKDKETINFPYHETMFSKLQRKHGSLVRSNHSKMLTQELQNKI